MSQFEARYDHIEAYLKGGLNTEEHRSFELEIENDPKLKEEVAIQKASQLLLEQVYLKEMSSIILEQSLSKPKTIWKWVFGGIVVLGCVLSVLIANDKTSSLSNVSGPQQSLMMDSQKEQGDISHQIKKVEEKELLKGDEEIVVIPTAKKDSTIVLEKTNKRVIEEQEKSLLLNEKVETDHSDFIESKDKKEADDKGEEKADCVLPKLHPIEVHDCHLNASDGELIVETKMGLFYSINDSEYLERPDSKQLEMGNYTIKAKNDLECIFELGTYTIKETACLSKRNFAFNILYEERLEVAIKEQLRAEIIILNKFGKQVFTTKIEESTMFEWNGRYDNGNEAELGIHKLIVKNAVNETCLYNVVIEK